MIRKNKFGTFTIYCDSCSDFFDTNEDSAQDAWEEAKSAGWTRSIDINELHELSYRSSGKQDVYHMCPECKEQRREARACRNRY